MFLIPTFGGMPMSVCCAHPLKQRGKRAALNNAHLWFKKGITYINIPPGNEKAYESLVFAYIPYFSVLL